MALAMVMPMALALAMPMALALAMLALLLPLAWTPGAALHFVLSSCTSEAVSFDHFSEAVSAQHHNELREHWPSANPCSCQWPRSTQRAYLLGWTQRVHPKCYLSVCLQPTAPCSVRNCSSDKFHVAKPAGAFTPQLVHALNVSASFHATHSLN